MMMFLALRATTGNDRAAEAGHVTVLMVMMAPILIFGFVGILWDGGQGVNRRAEVGDVAFGAARAGATQVDSNGAGISLNAAKAVEQANAYLARYPDVTGSVSVSGFLVTVTTEGSYDPAFMGAVGVDTWTFDASHTADAQLGVAANDDF